MQDPFNAHSRPPAELRSLLLVKFKNRGYGDENVFHLFLKCRIRSMPILVPRQSCDPCCWSNLRIAAMETRMFLPTLSFKRASAVNPLFPLCQYSSPPPLKRASFDKNVTKLSFTTALCHLPPFITIFFPNVIK